MNKRFLTGANSTCLFYFDNSKLVLNVSDWSIKEKLTTGEDHVNGELRARPWRILDGFDINLTAKIDDPEAVHIVFANSSFNDINKDNVPKNVNFILLVKTGKLYSLNTSGICIINSLEYSTSGRTDRLQLKISLWSQEIVENLNVYEPEQTGPAIKSDLGKIL